jgi:hypothetical protein
MRHRLDEVPVEHEVPSLVRGGPAWRLQHRLGLLGADGLPTLGGAVKVAAFCWLPLALLAGFDSRNWNFQYNHSFFTDLESYSRYLIAIFILLITDRATDSRLDKLLATFEETDIVNREMHAEFFKRIVAGDTRTSSALAEAIMLVLSVLVVTFSVYYLAQNSLTRWESPMTGFAGPLSPAGWWAVLVSAPLYFFLMFRWVWRLIVWTLLMRDIAKLPLRLVATHPDKAGGLGFLTIFPVMFLPLVFSLSMVFATGVLQTLLIQGGEVAQLEYTVFAWLMLVLIIFVGPLGLFTPRLLALKEQSILDFGVMVTHYNRMAEHKIRDDFAQGRPIDKDTVAMLADITVSLDTIKSIKIMPVEFFALIPLIVSALLPLIAVAAIKFPMGSLLWSLFTSLV